MTTNTINGQQVMTADEGKILIRTADGYTTTIVYLGAGDDGIGWGEEDIMETNEV